MYFILSAVENEIMHPIDWVHDDEKEKVIDLSIIDGYPYVLEIACDSLGEAQDFGSYTDGISYIITQRETKLLFMKQEHLIEFRKKAPYFEGEFMRVITEEEKERFGL